MTSASNLTFFYTRLAVTTQLGIQKQLLAHKSTKPVRLAKFQFPVELIRTNCTRKTAVVNGNSVFQDDIFVSGFMNIYYLGRVGHVGGALLLLTTALKMKETGGDLRKRDPIGIERGRARTFNRTQCLIPNIPSAFVRLFCFH